MQRNAPARSTKCSRLLRMWEVPYWSTVLLCSRQVKTLQQARGAGHGQGHRGRGGEWVWAGEDGGCLGSDTRDDDFCTAVLQNI